MINIKSDQNGIIQAIYNIECLNSTCEIESLPDDFYNYLGEGKYMANAQGLYIKPGWVDYNMLEIPVNPMVDYVMVSDCPVDKTLKRHIYWDGEDHVVGDHFTINLIVLHFNQDGTRNRQYDCKTWTRADKGDLMDDPLNEGQQVDEYDFFVAMVNTTIMPQMVQLGIYSAEDVLNKRIYGF